MQDLHERTQAKLGTQQAAEALLVAAAAETIGAPVRADLLLADKVLLHPQDAMRSTLATVAGSVLAGGALYLVGILLGFAGLLQTLHGFGISPWLLDMQLGMQNYGPLLLLAAGVATIPFSTLLLLAGLLGAAPLWLLPAAIAARGVRYGLLAWLLWRGGTRYRDWLNRYYHGLTMVVALGLLLLAVFLLLLKYL